MKASKGEPKKMKVKRGQEERENDVFFDSYEMLSPCFE
jgi:hypothetical protein